MLRQEREIVETREREREIVETRERDCRDERERKSVCPHERETLWREERERDVQTLWGGGGRESIY